MTLSKKNVIEDFPVHWTRVGILKKIKENKGVKSKAKTGKLFQ